jgi:hypothetical protein
MIVVGFAAYFWETPKDVVSENDYAAQNIARMEAQVLGSQSISSSEQERDVSQISHKLAESKEQQLRYLMILMMLFGAVFLIYSFINKKST